MNRALGRYQPRDFRGLLRFAAGSLHETTNHLLDARERGYIDAKKHERLRRLALRAIKANNRLMNYLRSATAPVPFYARDDENSRTPRTSRTSSCPLQIAVTA